MTEMNLKAGIDVELGRIKGRVFGGRFRQYVPGTRRLVGVKMAAEIDHPHDIGVPTEDFSVPSVTLMTTGILKGIEAMSQGNDLYVGCMGGIGRTGLYMGCMAKVCIDYHGGSYMGFDDPVKLVRANYLGHALETGEQQAYAREFKTEGILSAIETMVPVRVEYREVERIVEVPTSPLAWLKARLFG